MTMLESNSDGTEVLCNRFGYDINFVEGCTSSRQGTCDFVDKNRASEAAVCLEISKLGGESGGVHYDCSPPSDNASLGSANCNVVTDDKKFDLARLAWVLGGELLLRETEVEDISRVVSKPVVS